jgi:hypothetical protein
MNNSLNAETSAAKNFTTNEINDNKIDENILKPDQNFDDKGNVENHLVI